MKVLIIAPIFSPSNRIAAIRPTKLAKYFSRQEIDVTVITAPNILDIEDLILMEDEKEIQEVVRIQNSKLYKKVYKIVYGGYRRFTDNKNVDANKTETSKNISASHTQEHAVKKFVRSWMQIWEDYDYTNQVKRWVKSRTQNYDVVLSTYGPFSSHMIGRYVKKRNPLMVWIADFRDTLQYADERLLLGFWVRAFGKSTYKNANHIIGVSGGVIDDLHIPEKYLSRCAVITNGFDHEDRYKLANAEVDPEQKLRLLYTGQLYSGKRDLSIVFRAIRDLADEGELDLLKVEVLYAGGDGDKFIQQAQQYDMQSIARNLGFISRLDALTLQSASNVLLLASWNNVGSTGIVTGKFLEYLMMNKPILCTITGNLPSSALKDMINRANVGYCWEEANGQTDYVGLKSFLYQQYKAAIGKEELDFDPNLDYIKQFSYEHIANQFVALFPSD